MRRTLAILCGLVLAVAAQAQDTCLGPSAEDVIGVPVETDDPNLQIGGLFDYSNYTADVHRAHGGYDIYLDPFHLDDRKDGSTNPDAPWVRTTIAGTAKKTSNCFIDPDDPPFQEVSFYFTKDGYLYRYGHLSADALDWTFLEECKEEVESAAGRRLGRVWFWDECSPNPSALYSHLHYDVQEESGDPETRKVFDPSCHLKPWLSDSEGPTIDAVKLFENEPDPCDDSNAWAYPETPEPEGCQRVSGEVDIVATAHDRHQGSGAGQREGDRISPRTLSYRICSESVPSCEYVLTHDFVDIPYIWTAIDGTSQFCRWYSILKDPEGGSSTQSESNYCDQDSFSFIVTNMTGPNDLDPDGAWNVDPSKYPDGFYTVGIEATDFMGNTTTHSVAACVDEGGDCGGKLVVRDCDEDRGEEPSNCVAWGSSPDIIPADRMVCMTNRGCDTIHHSVTVTAEVAFHYRSAFNPWPWRPVWRSSSWTVSRTVGQLTRRTGSPMMGIDWPVGQERCITYPSRSLAVALAYPGSRSARVKVSMPGDTAHPTSSSHHDNNKAQVSYQWWSGQQMEVAAQTFLILPAGDVTRRKWTLQVAPQRANPGPMDVWVLLKPYLAAERLSGGELLGAYTTNRIADLLDGDSGVEDLTRNCRVETSGPGVEPSRCWQLVAGPSPGTVLELDGLELEHPSEVIVLLRSRAGGIGGAASLIVREFGLRRGQRSSIELGSITEIVQVPPGRSP